MSRRASTSDTRGKRRLSLTGEDSEKRTRPDNVRMAPHSRDAAAPGPPNSASSTSSTHSFQRGDRVSDPLSKQPLSRRDQEYSSPTMSSPGSSSSDRGSGTARGSAPPRHAHGGESSSSASWPRRPTWQTEGLSDRREQPHWQHDVRDSRDQLDQRSQSDSKTTSLSRGATPSTSALAPNPQAPVKNQAAFVNKLYSMLEDEKIAKSGLLYWSADGTSFVCPNPTEFSKEVLPNYFKHNNWQSFVRQLNMYSFNKVSDLYSTANSDPQAWEFRHNLFRRGQPEILNLIRRKPPKPHQDNQSLNSGEEDARPAPNWSQPGPSHTPHPQQAPYGISPSREYPPRQPYYQPRPSSSYELPRSPPRIAVPPPAPIPARPAPNGPMYPADSSRSEPPYYPHPPLSRPSPVDSLNAQLVSLQDQVYQLRGALTAERQANIQGNLELTHHMFRLTDSLYEASKDLRLPYDHLIHQRQQLQARIDALQAADMIRTLPSDGPREDRGSALSYEPSPRSLPAAMHDPRQVYTSHHHQTSPPGSRVPDRVRPSTGEPPGVMGSYVDSPRAYPARPPPSSDFRFRPPPLDDRMPRGEPSRARPMSRRETDPPPPQTPGDDPRPNTMDIDAPKTSIRSLLH